MLILREKTILVDGQPAKVYSLDGKLWFSRVAQLSINAPEMEALCDFLSEHLGDSIGQLENVEVNPHRF